MFTVRDKLFVIEVSTLSHTWKITSKLIAKNWVHVTFHWTTNEGIHLFLNGSAAQQKVFQKEKVSYPKPGSGLGWKLGRPNMLAKLSEYGQIGIAHLAKWKGELMADEIIAALCETILKEKKEMVEKELKLMEKAQTTVKPGKTDKLKPSKDARSTASLLSSYPVKLWAVILALCAILWLF
ncbi:uncharacterized protein LOC114541957 [Dendronephthya gigantea]|uniref:uncharacterized protein LOC114541957 n=1 Tax=Dendronephthya gigantea TaxID=151771 RepID=UPI00106C1ECE|nr:uncharacterized protein LOC114541957 [Dendronephthya gigantea]